MKKLLTIITLAIASMNLVACQATNKYAREAGEYISDSSITLATKEALMRNENTSASKIHVDTKEGVVTLSGVVRSQKERIAANEVAKKIDGVKRVDNALKLRSETRH